MKVYVVIGSLPADEGQAPGTPHVLGAFTRADVAAQVQSLAAPGARIASLTLDQVPADLARLARQQGLALGPPEPPSLQELRAARHSDPSVPAADADWQAVHRHLFERYQAIARHRIHALEDCVGRPLAQRTLRLIDHALAHGHEITEDKSSRWMGFIQGQLVAAGALRIDAERDYTRPLFHALKGKSPSHAV